MENKLFIADRQSSIFNQILFELRSEEIQSDRLRFRFNLERAGELLAYEISRDLYYRNQEVQTSLGSLEMPLLEELPVVVSILRAGLPFHAGILRMFDRSDSGFISAYRHHFNENDFEIRVEYHALPAVQGKTVILADPMIATGASLIKAYETIVASSGLPAKVIIVGLLGSEEGIEVVSRRIPDAKIYLGALDKELTAKSYIVPGLGDAGDLAFGVKI